MRPLRGQRELPAQVDRILDAAVHALGARRAVDVGGVAGEERAAGPEGCRQPMLQRNLDRPGHVAGPDPPPAGQLDNGPDVVGGRRGGGGPAVLDGQQPPPRLLTDRHEDEDAVEGLALLGFVYLGPMQALLGHRPLTLAQLLPVLAAPVLLFAAEEARKAAIRRHRRMVAGSIGPAPAGQGTLRRRTTAG
jgi:hypothetical protein